MRSKVLKTVTSIGSAALILAGAANAGAPTSFDKWSMAAGAITLGDYDGGTAGNQTCPVGFTCNTPVTGDGFMQRQLVRTADSAQFFQTIVTDLGVTGAPSALSFADESFVQSGLSGLASKQQANVAGVGTYDNSGVSLATTTAFTTSSQVLTGWGLGGTDDKIQVSQGLTETITATSEMVLKNQFNLAIYNDGTSKSFNIDQGMMLGKGATTTGNADDDLQRFVMKEYSGAKNGTAHALNTPKLLWSGGDVAWAATDDAKVIWVGQQMAKTGGESFAFESYDNLTSAANDLTSEFQLGQTLPFTWVAPFGAAPVMTLP